MIQIKKATGGYTVAVVASNNEILSSSEVLKTKQAAYKNIIAQSAIYEGSNPVFVNDMCRGEKIMLQLTKGKIIAKTVF